MPAIKITPERVAAYARILQTARTARAIDEEGFQQLHARFVVRTANGAPWTVGLATGNWNHVREGRWVPGEPPTELYLESEVLFELERLKSAMDSGAPDTPPAPSSGASSSTARDAEIEVPTAHDIAAAVSSPRDIGSATPTAHDTGTVTPAAPDTGTAAPLSHDTGAQAPQAHDTEGATAPAPNPRPAPERIVERPSSSEWSPAVLCLGLGVALAAIGYAKSNLMAYGAAVLFAVLLVSILVLHSQSRRP